MLFHSSKKHRTDVPIELRERIDAILFFAKPNTYYHSQWNWNVLAPLYRYSSIGYSISHNLCLFLNFWSQYNSLILLLLSCEEYSKTYWSNSQNASAKQCWHIFMEWLLLLIPYNLFQFHEKFNENKNLLLGIAALHQRLVRT